MIYPFALPAMQNVSHSCLSQNLQVQHKALEAMNKYDFIDTQSPYAWGSFEVLLFCKQNRWWYLWDTKTSMVNLDQSSNPHSILAVHWSYRRINSGHLRTHCI